MSGVFAASGTRFSRRGFAAMMAVAGVSIASGRLIADERSVVGSDHPLVPALRHAKTCLEKAEAMKGYECQFAKKEVVGTETISQTMKMKVRQDPFSVYMLFQDPNEGREVIYVDGRNNGNLLVHESGFASLIGTLELAPDSSQVMAENRYPITKAGLAKMVEVVIEQWEEETKYGETEVKYFEDAKVGEYKCRVIESAHPQPRKRVASR